MATSLQTRLAHLFTVAVALAAGGAAGAEEALPTTELRPFTLHVEVKAAARDTRDLAFKINYPFPKEFIPPGQNGVYMRPPQAGSSLELASVAVSGEGDLASGISARLAVHFLDLWNRNPTSLSDRVFVREAWITFGKKYDALRPMPGSSLYLLVGKAPRFSKQLDRRLESYGLWGTAVSRFEQMQAQVGGSIGKHVYFRAHYANPNPLFMRDPNALAGDNGTPERAPGHVDPIYQSGFPILYDARGDDLNTVGKWEWGGGLGLRFVNAGTRDGIDILGWSFTRQLADRVRIRGTYYSGDLLLLQFAALPAYDRDKKEYGANLEARLAGLRFFGQYVHQDIGGLVRKGYEAELAYRLALPGLFASGDQPVVNWIQPAVRYSRIDNGFWFLAPSVAPSLAWDWQKLDFGVRLGIVRGVDLTVEFARHDMILHNGRRLHPDEILSTLRWAI